jgi:hypothetical protein
MRFFNKTKPRMSSPGMGSAGAPISVAPRDATALRRLVDAVATAQGQA